MDVLSRGKDMGGAASQPTLEGSVFQGGQWGVWVQEIRHTVCELSHPRLHRGPPDSFFTDKVSEWQLCLQSQL